MKNLRNTILFSLILASSGLPAMEGSDITQPLTNIKIGLYVSPENVNFTQIKEYISQLKPEHLEELNKYDSFIDGTVLDLTEDRKKQFGDYETEYNEIIQLLKQKGAQTAPERKYPHEKPALKL